MTREETRRLEYQKQQEAELLTEGKLGLDEWHKQASWAARQYYNAKRHSDPWAHSTAMARMLTKVFSIAEVKRAAKEGWWL